MLCRPEVICYAKANRKCGVKIFETTLRYQEKSTMKFRQVRVHLRDNESRLKEFLRTQVLYLVIQTEWR